jgi:MFS family permease
MAESGQARSALYAVAFLSSLGFSIVVPFLVLLVLHFGGNAFVVGTISAAFWAAQLVGSMWLGTLSDRIGRKRVLFRSQLGALAAWAVFLAALCLPAVELARVDRPIIGAFVVTLPLLLIAFARIVDGLFNGSVSVASAYVADIADEMERKLAYGKLGAATNLGFVLGPVISGVIARGSVRAVLVLALVLSPCTRSSTTAGPPASSGCSMRSSRCRSRRPRRSSCRASRSCRRRRSAHSAARC